MQVVQGAIGAPAGAWIHYGLTSSDVGDTCYAVQMKQSADILIGDVQAELARVALVERLGTDGEEAGGDEVLGAVLLVLRRKQVAGDLLADEAVLGVDAHELQPYLPADPEQIEKQKVEVRYLGYYLKWHPQSCYYYSVEHGGFLYISGQLPFERSVFLRGRLGEAEVHELRDARVAVGGGGAAEHGGGGAAAVPGGRRRV